MLARRLLPKQDLTPVQVVEAQATLDPDFYSCSKPRNQATFALAEEELGRQVGAVVMFLLRLTRR